MSLPSPDHRARDQALDVVLHQERVSVQLERVPVERIVVRRRIVTEIRQVQVTLRREELEVHHLPATGQETDRPAFPPRPLVLVLSEEVPVVQVVTRPYEQVVVHVDTITTHQPVTVSASHEQVDIAQTGTAP